WFAHRNFAPGAAINFFCAEILLRDFVTPIAKCAFGKFHDVSLVHQGHALPLEFDRVTDCAVNQANAARPTDRLDPYPHENVIAFRCSDSFPKLRGLLLGAEANLLECLRKFFLEKIEDFLRSI